ncbi:MAG: MMPL family transporter, partial [Cellulomonadaceae bacterium]|nr:MMPL family transporter [Cellulomonadaceae bacterium]
MRATWDAGRVFDTLGRLLARHPRTAIAAWAVFTVVCFALTIGGVTGQTLFDRLSTGNPTVPGSDSSIAEDILTQSSTAGESLSLAVDGVDPADPDLPDQVAAARDDLLAIDHVASVIDPYLVPGGPTSPAAAPLLAADGRGFLVVVELEHGIDDDAQDAALAAVESRLRAVPGDLTGDPTASGQVGGTSLIVAAITDQVELDLRTGETIALPIALLVMVLVFGGFLSAAMPMVGALASIAGGLGSVLLLSQWLEMDASVVNVVTILGLGLSID